MQYLPDLAYQTRGFVFSMGLGFALGFIFDLLKVIFLLFTGSEKKWIALRDIMFSLVSVSFTFIFLLVMCDGEVVFYALSGELIGFFVFLLTVSKAIGKPILGITKKMRKEVINFKKNVSEKITKMQKKLQKTVLFQK